MAKKKPLSTRDFLSELAAFAEEQRRLIESECLGFDTDPEQRSIRREKSWDDFWFFSYTYFPHYIKTRKRSVFHVYMHNTLPGLVDSKDGKKEAIVAPRGEAKSTYVTLIFVLWCIVTNRKKFPVIIMDAFDQASLMLEAIKAEFEVNPRLAMDYPECSGQGKVWQASTIITANKCMVKVAGAGKKLRGYRYGPHRPDLVVLDDIENDENVKSPEQRNKLEKWLNSAVLKLGPPEGTMDVIYVGTILHYDSVLNRTRKKPTWHCHKAFKAIIRFPDNMDLWEKWEEILLNDSEEIANEYYHNNKILMDQGAVVSWPTVRPLLLLMKIRADDHHAFASEMQNDPTDNEDSLFKDLTYWVHPCRNWVFYGAVDPSLGKKNRKRDPSAILVGGFDREHGILDVVEANIARRLPILIIHKTIEYQREYACQVWGIEAVQFQEFFRTQLIQYSIEAGIPVPAQAIIPHTDKNLRIESLQPFTSNGSIRFNPNQSTLIEQLTHYPEADHDDGPDDLQMLWMLAVSRAGGSVRMTRATKRQFRQSFAGYN
jgi:predicted phage terminase large subunit-like protein